MCHGMYVGSPDMYKKNEPVKKQLSAQAVKNKETDRQQRNVRSAISSTFANFAGFTWHNTSFLTVFFC